MKVRNWHYGKERKDLNPYLNNWGSKSESGKWIGAVYAVKFEVNGKFSLIKIGATSMPKERLVNFGPRGKLYCVSPPCTNFFEIESFLHEYFNRYRVPGRTKSSEPEYFNMSIPFFLSNLPELNFRMD